MTKKKTTTSHQIKRLNVGGFGGKEAAAQTQQRGCWLCGMKRQTSQRRVKTNTTLQSSHIFGDLETPPASKQ